MTVISLKKNGFYSLSGQAIYNLTQWLLLILIARLSNVAALGSFTLGLAISAPLVMFFSFRLRLLLASDIQEEYVFIEYLAIRIFAMFLALLGIVIIGFFFFYHNLFFFGTALCIGAAKCCEGVSEIFLTLTQFKEKTRYIPVSLSARGGLTVIAMAVTLYFTGNILWASLSFLLVRLGVLYFYDMHIPVWLGVQAKVLSEWREYVALLIKDPKKRQQLLRFLKMGLPLAVVAVLDSVNTNTPGYFITYFLGHKALGYYAPLNYVLTGSIVLVGMMLLPSVPSLTRYYRDGKKSEFYALLLKIIGFIIVISIIMITGVTVLGGWLLHVMFGAKFAAYHSVFVWLIVAAALNYLALLFIYLLTAMRKIRAQIFCFSATIFVSILSCVLLIPHWGLQGAAWSVVLYSATLLGTTALSTFYRARNRSPLILDTQ